MCVCVWTIPVDCEGLCACVCVDITCRFWIIVYMCVWTLPVDCGGLYACVCGQYL